MQKSLLFIPDISGYTKFIQTTEVEHSQHVISELLEVLISANTQDLKLAEIEGDALFFYKEEEIPSQENLLAQIELMFTAFYSHLKMLEKNRICPCNACATAPDLELKIIAHCGVLQHIEVQGNRKPFGEEVIRAHRLLKNSVDSDNYALVSKDLAQTIELSDYYYSKVFRFLQGSDSYDGQEVPYIYTLIDQNKLNLRAFEQPRSIDFDCEAPIALKLDYPVSANALMEYITNYKYRHLWVKGVDSFEYNDKEVTRLGSEHICVINGKHLNFVTVTKTVGPDQLIYGELTTSPPIVDKLYQFYTFTPLTDNSCKLGVEIFWEARSPLKKLFIALIGKRTFQKNTRSSMQNLHAFVSQNQT
ncbi:DUF2652 domain-containing protein [Spongiimicrobium sp. 3-5]|uniref:DUF2652 domain-containing protein n=1 Tax=Spongiimicrobium sp. 3-5 TaxID=3332596 RepID=UPI0039807A3D